MAMENKDGLFADSVKNRLLGWHNAESLWVAVAQEYVREGPDAAIEYLAGEKQRLVERVHRLLVDVEGDINA